MSRLGQRSNNYRSLAAGLVGVLSAVLCLGAAVEAACGPFAAHKIAGPLRAVATGETCASDAAGLTVAPDGRVQVEILFRAPQDALNTDLGPYGATVQFRRGDRVQALAPRDRLMDIARLQAVTQIAPPAPLIPCQGFGPVRSEAVQSTNARAMHVAGFRGAPTRIAIIDLGFANLDTAEVPVDPDDPTVLFSLRADGSTTASSHGSAVAEHVADMAPEASLTLIAVDTPMSILSAIDYVVARRYQVAVMSLVVLEGPFDGTHPLAQAVNNAAAAGVLWVQAAGNFAQRHWAGTFTDTRGNNIHEFARGLEYMSITVEAGGEFRAFLSWFETAGSRTEQDYDMFLFDSAGNFIAQSAYTQDGTTPPREVLDATLPAADTYRLQIRRMGGDPTQNDRFKFFFQYPTGTVPSALRVPEGSLATPAEAPGALTVGAVRGTTVDVEPYEQYPVPPQPLDTLEEWSAQGPTVSGRLKPDIVAPNACRTSFGTEADPVYDTYFNEWLGPSAFGTSFAAAHVAGAAALLWSEDNTRTASELRNALINMAVPVPPPLPPVTPLPNNRYGHGRLSLRVGTDIAKPEIEIVYPRPGATITTTRPTITAYLSDVGMGIDPTTIELRLNDEQVSHWFDPDTGILSYTPTRDLSRSSHRITIDVADRAGNQADRAVCSFRVSPPMIDAGVHMISIPYGQLDDLRPSRIFGLPPEQVIVVRWLPTDTRRGDKYHWWGGPTGIEDMYASFDPLDAHEPPYVVSDPPAGLGYFLSIPSTAILNVSGRSLMERTHYEIKLSAGFSEPRGWNMIGCPFENPATWGGVQFITNGVRQDLREAITAGVTDGVLFELKRAGSAVYYDFPADPLAGVLQPWKGYWVRVHRDTTLVVYNAVITMDEGAAPTPARPEPPSENRWTLRFGASAAGGKDPANYIGIAPAATDSFDFGHDVAEPPALDNPVRVYMKRDDWGEHSGRYVKDVRGALGLGQEWDVTVECAQADADVTLSWPELNATVPAGVTLILQDLDAGRDVWMRTVGSYTYRSAGEADTRRFRIIARPTGQGSLALANVTALQARDGTVQLTYTVSSPAQVTAEVLNISGRTIRRLSATSATPGEIETVAWDGRNAHGARAPAGRYLVRLTARGEDGQVAQAVRAFQVGR